MTIAARPFRLVFSPEKLVWTSGEEPGSVWIECECIAPPSFAEKRDESDVLGPFVSRHARRVKVYLSAQDVTELMLLLRERAIFARSQPESDPNVYTVFDAEADGDMG